MHLLVVPVVAKLFQLIHSEKDCCREKVQAQVGMEMSMGDGPQRVDGCWRMLEELLPSLGQVCREQELLEGFLGGWVLPLCLPLTHHLLRWCLQGLPPDDQALVQGQQPRFECCSSKLEGLLMGESKRCCGLELDSVRLPLPQIAVRMQVKQQVKYLGPMIAVFAVARGLKPGERGVLWFLRQRARGLLGLLRM